MSRCDTCEYDARYARATGPLPAEVLAIGEKPGKQEAFRGEVFCGDSGEEVNQTYFPLAGLDRPEVRMCNTVRCWLGGNNNKPTDKQIQACASHHLPNEIVMCEPKTILLLGATACSLVPTIELDKDHGIPFWLDSVEGSSVYQYFGQWSGWVWPINHPAAALHSTSMMIPLLEDFKNLGRWREGKWAPPIPDNELLIDYRVLSDVDEIEFQLANSDYTHLPLDTEDDCGRFWSLQFSPRPGAGYLLHQDDKLLQQFRRLVKEHYKGLLMHHCVHDLDVLGQIGAWEQGDGEVLDTMQQAFQLGDQPQGLKALAWRLLGIRMRSWADIVMPPSRTKMIEWLMAAWDEVGEEREVIEVIYKKAKRAGGKRAVDNPIVDLETGLILGRREYRPLKAEKDVKRILTHSHKPKYDIWDKATAAGLTATSTQLEAWRKKLDEQVMMDNEDGNGELEAWELAELADLEQRNGENGKVIGVVLALALQKACGPPPLPSIINADYTEAVQYACRDADITGQVALVMSDKRRDIVSSEWRVSETDWDGN